MVAEIEGAEDISVRKLTLAVDVGEAINPDGVINQIEGGAIQATSWVLKERVRFDRQRITSTSWTEYPILRFSEVPDVEVEVIQRPEVEPVGAGEAAHGPVTAAIANAVFDALGVRVRDSADHARQHHRRDGIDLHEQSEHPERRRGAGPGRKPCTGVQGPNRLRDCGEFGAVGVMADKLRKGTPADIVILTAALVAKLAEEKLIVAATISDVGLVETALAVRTGDPQAAVRDAADLREALLASDAIFVPGYQSLDGRNSRCKCPSAARHRRRGCRPPPDFPEWRNRDARTGGVRGAASDRVHAIDRDHQHQGRDPVRLTAAGLRTRNHVHGGHHDRRRPPAASARA